VLVLVLVLVLWVELVDVLVLVLVLVLWVVLVEVLVVDDVLVDEGTDVLVDVVDEVLVDVLVEVLVDVVGGGASSAVASPMNAFTADSSWFVCPLCVQSLPDSAFETAEENLLSAFPRQLESTAMPFETAFDWHFNLFDAFFPAAWIFFASQVLGPAALLFTMFRMLSTKVSTFASMAFASPFGARQSPLASAFVNPEVSLSCALARQSESTPVPFDTAFE
jgi:hypothetical protein